MTLSRSRKLYAVGAALAALVCIGALDAVGELYGGFRMPQHGLYIVPAEELVFLTWYVLWGTAATAALVTGLVVSGVEAKLHDALQWVVSRPRGAVAAAGVAVFALALIVRFALLRSAPVADDELTYLFEARTLLAGRVINPPLDAPEFFRNQFVLANSRGWFGKYPLGHPLLLALGEALHARWLVVPLLGFGTVALSFAVGRRFFGTARAVLGACLLAASPHFVGTLATQQSQPSAVFFLLLGSWCALRFLDDRQARWGLGSGAAFGFALLVRPMPTALIVATVALALNARWRSERAAAATQLRDLAMLAPGLALGLAGLLLHNHAMTGNPFASGYEAAHGAQFYTPPTTRIATSLGGALLRENFWLFGWPLSLLFIPWARPTRAPWLFWGPIAAVGVYRMVLPKLGVATTGPVYLFEAVPLLALATADGAVRASEVLAPLGVTRTRVTAFAVAASLVALAAFAPLLVRALGRCADARQGLPAALAGAGAARALVFVNTYVNTGRRTTWAMFPPNPSPDLSDTVLHLRLPTDAGGVARAHAYWRRRFPDRRAFVFEAELWGSRFVELSADAPPDATIDAAAFLARAPTLPAR